MKKTALLIAITGMLLAALAAPARAAEKPKEVTLTGEGKCAKCALNETKECQTVVQLKEGDKTITYYLTPNKTSKDFHKNVCEETKKITVTGKVQEKEGKKMLTASKIELTK